MCNLEMTFFYFTKKERENHCFFFLVVRCTGRERKSEILVNTWNAKLALELCCCSIEVVMYMVIVMTIIIDSLLILTLSQFDFQVARLYMLYCYRSKILNLSPLNFER